ncbi:type IV toxin-antitoxin system AbiEi family antitoxin domain-containing protein [Xylanimonas sp. McL0601]|uniref:type IV toxin-antitoxin system AbiEi family antitoxin domain-containing protein n=1 Tax=Xylanimonas sp. McL0601 TaxID=3414739 RepID=UPI003CED5E89
MAAQQEQLVSARQLVAHGVPYQRIADRVHQGSLTCAAVGVYDCEPTAPGGRTMAWARARGWAEPGAVFDHLCRRSATLALLERGDLAVAVGLAALALHGVRGLPRAFVPSVGFPTRAPRSPADGSQVRRLRGLEVTTTASGLRVAPLEAALAQGVLELTRRADGRTHAVAVLDDVLSRGLLDDAGLHRARAHLRRRKGALLAREWWDLADAGSQSPAETWARLSCLERGVPPDWLQLEVENAFGAVVARVDMAWRLPDGRYLFAEIDGEDVHSTPRAVFHDRARQNLLADIGTVLRFTGADAWHGRVGLEVAARIQPRLDPDPPDPPDAPGAPGAPAPPHAPMTVVGPWGSGYHAR